MAENRKSLTLVETICADGTALPPVIIVQGRQHMAAWYNEKLTGKERVMLSDSGYTNNELGLHYLEHFIEHTNATINGPKRVLLMDGHNSHITPEFTLRASKANIHPYQFPSHLTHVMQPLDVGVFQPYKHWHKKAIQHAMRNLDVDYNIASFFRDLTEIRANTFKKGTIIGAFRKSGIWPINYKEACDKMKIYSIPEREVQTVELPGTPTTFSHSENHLQFWKEKLPVILSSPTARKWESFSRGTENVLATGTLVELQYELLSTRVTAQQKAKVLSRKVVKANGGILTVEEAYKQLELKAQKEKEEKERSLRYTSRVELNKIKKQVYTLGVQARKAERARKQQITELGKAKKAIPIELQLPIQDPSKETTEMELREAANERIIALTGQLGLFEPTGDPQELKDEPQEQKSGEETGFLPFDSDGSEYDYNSDTNIDPGLY